MKLNDFNRKNSAKTALQETFEMNFDVTKLSRTDTNKMLGKVQSLIKEAKLDSEFYNKKLDPAYTKLIFMEQALNDHYEDLRSGTYSRIVVENEEVEKSQVILAAQDMVDQVQKMYENINDMLVKELPALVDSIESEIGVNESVSFQEQVGTTLSNLNNYLQEARAELDSSLNQLTGQAPSEVPDFETEEPAPEEEVDIDTEVDTEVDTTEPVGLEDEEPEMGVVGREKR